MLYHTLRPSGGSNGQFVEVSTKSAKTPRVVYSIRVKGTHTTQRHMRKIEQQMNTAIAEGKSNWKLDNTRVVTVNEVAHVFLHDNKIAEIGEGFIVLMDGGWQSVTTKSRLNAILSENGLPGERVYQKDYVWNVRLSDGTSIPFFSGMRLN